MDRDCMLIFMSEALQKKLRSLKFRIACKTDIWTFIQNLSYLCFIANFVDSNWVLHLKKKSKFYDH